MDGFRTGHSKTGNEKREKLDTFHGDGATIGGTIGRWRVVLLVLLEKLDGCRSFHLKNSKLHGGGVGHHCKSYSLERI